MPGCTCHAGEEAGASGDDAGVGGARRGQRLFHGLCLLAVGPNRVPNPHARLQAHAVPGGLRGAGEGAPVQQVERRSAAWLGLPHDSGRGSGPAAEADVVCASRAPLEATLLGRTCVKRMVACMPPVTVPSVTSVGLPGGRRARKQVVCCSGMPQGWQACWWSKRVRRHGSSAARSTAQAEPATPLGFQHQHTGCNGVGPLGNLRGAVGVVGCDRNLPLIAWHGLMPQVLGPVGQRVGAAPAAGSTAQGWAVERRHACWHQASGMRLLAWHGGQESAKPGTCQLAAGGETAHQVGAVSVTTRPPLPTSRERKPTMNCTRAGADR